jgi:hypothetical protein
METTEIFIYIYYSLKNIKFRKVFETGIHGSCFRLESLKASKHGSSVLLETFTSDPLCISNVNEKRTISPGSLQKMLWKCECIV